MKSSVFGFLPWNHIAASKCETISKPVIKSSVESDKMSGKVCLSYNNSQQKRQLKMTPLLRLNSEGEISTGNNFCNSSSNRAVVNKSHLLNTKLRLSNSFDSYSGQESFLSSSPSASESLNSIKNKNHHIPCRPSFNKSLSEPNRQPAHQSFPPPSSSLSAIPTRNNFACPMANRMSPYSSSPRVLGSVDIFGIQSSFNHPPSEMHHTSNHKTACSSSAGDCSDIVNGHRNMKGQNIRCSPNSKSHDQQSKCNQMENITAATFNVLVRCDKCSIRDHDNGKVASAIEVNNAGCENGSSINSLMNCSKNKHSQNLLEPKKKKRRSRSKRKSRRTKEGSFSPSSCSSSGSSPMKSSEKRNDCVWVDNHASSGVANSNANSIVSDGTPPIKCQASQSKTTILSPVSKSSNSVKSILFCSDSDFSDDDSLFEDSVVFFEDTPNKRKRKGKQDLHLEKCSSPCVENQSLETSQNKEKKSPPSSLHFAFFSLAVSEDEDNDDSVDWDSEASPSTSDQFIFEVEFSTGLSLEDIIGQKKSTTTAKDCSTTIKLKDLNKKWNELYASTTTSCDDYASRHQKVHFASDVELETVFVVGNEDRGGNWHHFAREEKIFRKKIEDIEAVLTPVLCENHRAKVLERMQSNVSL